MHPQPGCKVMTREQLNEGDINSVVAGASLLPAAGTLYLLAEVTATVSFSLTIKIGEGSNWDMETGILLKEVSHSTQSADLFVSRLPLFLPAQRRQMGLR